MKWAPGTPPRALSEVGLVQVTDYRDPPCFNETHVTFGERARRPRNIVSIGLIEAIANRPPAVRYSRRGAQGPGRTCCIILYAFYAPVSHHAPLKLGRHSEPL